MRVLYLFNKVLGERVAEAKNKKGHDSWLFGMLRLPAYGIDTDFLEIEKYVSPKITCLLRRYILTMHYAHLPLFPLFFRYDIVFTSTAFSALVLKSILRIKSFKWVILDFNLVSTIGDRSSLRQKIFGWAVGKSDGIVAISSAEADALRRMFPHLKEKIIFLYEATDIDFFAPDQGVPVKDQVISVGNYGRDFKTPIEAVKGMKTKLLIASKLIKGEEKERLPENVIAEHLSQEELLKAYRESKIAIVSIEKEDEYFDSVGTLSLGEAFAMGMPTIVTKMRSMESYVEDGKNAIFVARHDAAGMRKAIERILQDGEYGATLGSNARAFAKEHLDADAFARRLAGFLKKV